MTSNLNTDIPILRLHTDILLLIFTINVNADIFSPWHKTLRTVRYSSQVCTAWRDIMLDTPSLWGKLFDLDEMAWASDNWANEVLRRSADSLLWIKSRAIHTRHSKSRAKFLFTLLNNHWDRIEKLEVYFRDDDLEWCDSWQTLYLPSPHLQVFDLDAKEGHGGALLAGAPLFANHAPSLRQFRARSFTFNIHETLDFIPSLREFSISPHQEKITGLNFPSVVNLHQLLHLELFLNFEDSITLLDHIITPPNCSLTFQPPPVPIEFMNHDSLQALLPPLLRFTQRYLLSHPPKQLLLSCSPDQFTFGDDPSMFHADLYIAISCWSFPAHAIALLVEAFTFPELLLTVEELLWTVGDLDSPAMFKSFLGCFPSIKVMEADEHAIDHLMCIQEEISDLLFPLLRIVKIYPPNPSASGPILPFLRSRRDAGYPIEILDLSECKTNNLAWQWEFLEEISGLKILWTDKDLHSFNQVVQYECGGGK